MTEKQYMQYTIKQHLHYNNIKYEHDYLNKNVLNSIGYLEDLFLRNNIYYITIAFFNQTDGTEIEKKLKFEVYWWLAIFAALFNPNPRELLNKC